MISRSLLSWSIPWPDIFVCICKLDESIGCFFYLYSLKASTNFAGLIVLAVPDQLYLALILK